MLTPRDIENLATLSRLAISADEQAGLAKDLESILGYVSELSSAPAAEGEEIYLVQNVLREDGEPRPSGEYTERILAQAPKREGNYLKVKQILGGTDAA